MTVWMVRAGRRGEGEQTALEQGVAVIGKNIGDVSKLKTIAEIQEAVAKRSPNASPNAVKHHAAQIFAFANTMKPGDLVVLPLKSTKALAIGEVTDRGYKFVPENPPDAQQTRGVKWLVTDLARSALKQDLLFSLGAFMTVCRIERNEAEARLRVVLKNGKDPGSNAVTEIKQSTKGNSLSLSSAPTDEDAEEELGIDLEEAASSQIMRTIAEDFAGHALTDLVEALLLAKGYITLPSPPGADGGVDILAGKGDFGFDVKGLCVQVKSGPKPSDVNVVRNLVAAAHNHGARNALLVSWGGFTSAVFVESKRSFFNLKLWGAEDLVGHLQNSYEDLPSDIRSRLPLKRVWMLAKPDSEEEG